MNLTKRFIFLGIFVFMVFSCKTNQATISENGNSIVQMHHRVAVLPFKVIFSDEYKAMSRGRSQGNWPEQERVAGLDLQKQCFGILSKRAEKKHFGFTVQDFLTTNKALQRENIRFSELQSIDKGKLARLLGVDAVIWGETQMQYSMRNFMARNGMNTMMQLWDAETAGLVWQNTTFTDVSNRMDSPQDLASRSVSNLISSLPYKSQNH
ncbi:hypothetical protein EGI22_12955 [Lacihabitans sp. LS3-19]|uniref:hypothetical protein n=1 Tax=Lacihabitans sp. LS3-19 TaxID=2487335 RepID=UPI0020CD87E1|nr:hypothetical protein [Lacihabitans sp. LS3-19]MCP9768828.1 hypothetical protein [Lacihabitans sp. LS3-19]